jgi:FkbM family methyltransferase
MPNPLKPLTMPEYFFRPSQLLLRIRRLLSGVVAGSDRMPESDRVRLPWGHTITVRPREVIGAAIWWYGIFDLIVTEAIWRLLDEGETALDIGANLGQMTSLMRYRAGPAGKVIAFEPHPTLFAELSVIAQETPPGLRLAPAETHQSALSDHEGEAFLDLGNQWEGNRGLAKVVGDTSAGTGSKLKIQLTTLDRILSPETKVGVCKIDVEGHEAAVFKGAARVLAQRGIRDIIFEDFQPYPGAVHQLLMDHGFTLFSLHSRLWRPVLQPASGPAQFSTHDGVNYLGTLDPERARQRFKSSGWFVLRSRGIGHG